MACGPSSPPATLGDAADRRNLPGLGRSAGLDVAVLVNNAGFTTVGDVHRIPTASSE